MHGPENTWKKYFSVRYIETIYISKALFVLNYTLLYAKLVLQ
jgi:hypothetical protein